ncbi:serine threonine-protein kinase [Balamuthia mandrillaris]
MKDRSCRDDDWSAEKEPQSCDVLLRCVTCDPSRQELKQYLAAREVRCRDTHRVTRQEEALVFRIKNYVVDELLERGAGGRVYKAYACAADGQRLQPEEEVAIKVIEKKPGKEALVAKVRREYTIMFEVEHKHVCRLIEVVENPKRICLIMPFAKGGDLCSHILRRGKLTEPEARVMFRQLLEAVRHVHRRGYFHRDIKPENILLDEHNNILLTDFGLSDAYSALAPTSLSCGSLCYAAPEVISGTPYVGPEVDIWSCGTVLYAMVTGKKAFGGITELETFRKIQKGKFRPAHHLSNNLMDLLHCMLNPDAMKRITMAGIFEHPWMVSRISSVPHRRYSAESIHYTPPARLLEAHLRRKVDRSSLCDIFEE